MLDPITVDCAGGPRRWDRENGRHAVAVQAHLPLLPGGHSLVGLQIQDEFILVRVKTETNLTVEIFAYRPTCLLSLHLMLGLTGSLVLRTIGVVEWRTAGSLVAPRGK